MSGNTETKRPKTEEGCRETDSDQQASREDADQPLHGLLLAPHDVLEKAQLGGRIKCSKCGGSRMFYCYTCYTVVGLNPHLIPTVKLPMKIDIIKHPNETDGKSTAVHAKLIAPGDVSIYTYPCIPELDDHRQNIVLVFPGPDAMTVEELPAYFHKTGGKSSAETSTETRKVKKLKVEEQKNSSQTNACVPEVTDDLEQFTCPVQRVIFIDSTWNQTTRIITDERLQALPQVELKSRKTCFWRHQRGSPDTYLATIEAIYYFLKDFHIHCLLREYKGEYDNLLFFYSFLHKLIIKAKKDTGKL